jgi:hypothetical protein
VRKRCAEAPFAFGWWDVKQIVADSGEQTAEPAERDLRDREDARGLVGFGRERGAGHLLFLERVEERVRGIGRRIDVTPAPRSIQIGETRESRQRAVKG